MGHSPAAGVGCLCLCCWKAWRLHCPDMAHDIQYPECTCITGCDYACAHLKLTWRGKYWHCEQTWDQTGPQQSYCNQLLLQLLLQLLGFRSPHKFWGCHPPRCPIYTSSWAAEDGPVRHERLGDAQGFAAGQPWTVWHCTQKSHLPTTDCPWRFPVCAMHH